MTWLRIGPSLYAVQTMEEEHKVGGVHDRRPRFLAQRVMRKL